MTESQAMHQEDVARVLIHMGKGGVGKTTTAAATAVGLARQGQRTLVLSTDPAHSLSDVLDRPLGDQPTPVIDNLHAEQLRARQRLDAGWRDIGTYLQELLRWGGAGELEAAELAVLPGLDELFALLDLHAHATSGRYDVVVVDCAPTAETLRLLSLPEVLGWYVERLIPLQRTVTRALRPALRHVTTMPVPRDPVFAAVETLYRRLQAVRALLLEPRVTSVRMVVTPHRVVLAEARRSQMLLGLFGYALDAVVVNRLVPDGSDDPLVAGWHAAQREALVDLAETFGAVPRLSAGLRANEPVGVAALAELADEVYGARDPSVVLYEGPRIEVVADNAGPALRVPLPRSSAGDVELFQRHDELYIRVDGYARNIVLPVGLGDRRVTAATVEGGWLRIAFSDTGAPVPAGSRNTEA
jgi:arsenite/tail-anchored protein-transporting ATPase